MDAQLIEGHEDDSILKTTASYKSCSSQPDDKMKELCSEDKRTIIFQFKTCRTLFLVMWWRQVMELVERVFVATRYFKGDTHRWHGYFWYFYILIRTFILLDSILGYEKDKRANLYRFLIVHLFTISLRIVVLDTMLMSGDWFLIFESISLFEAFFMAIVTVVYLYQIEKIVKILKGHSRINS